MPFPYRISPQLKRDLLKAAGPSTQDKLDTSLRQAGDFIYQGGTAARDARDQYLRRLAIGNQAKIDAQKNALRTDAMAEDARPSGVGANQLSADDELTNRLTRAKGISRILSATQNTGDTELLRDRMTTAAAGRLGQMSGLRGMGKYIEMRSGVQSGLDAAGAYRDANRQNAIGSLAGIAAGIGTQAYQSYVNNPVRQLSNGISGLNASLNNYTVPSLSPSSGYTPYTGTAPSYALAPRP